MWASSQACALTASATPKPGPGGYWLRRPSVSGLEAWMIALGIQVLQGASYHPQTQSKCERLNQTLGARAA